MYFAALDSSLFLPKTNPVTEKLAETAARIAISHFEWRYITLLLLNSTILNEVGDFCELYDKSFVINNGLHRPHDEAEVTRQYIVFGTDIPDITEMLDWLQMYHYDNNGRYIVICQSNENCDETEAVATLWYHRITNVIFLKQLDGIVSGYTYFYSADNCAMSAPDKIDDLETCLNSIDESEVCDMFPEKFDDLFGCPLIASTIRQPPYMYLAENEKPKGSDGDLLVIIAEAMNATLKVITPQIGDGWGYMDDEGNWLGSLADIYYDLANISVTSSAITYQRYLSFQLSYAYNFVTMGWITCPTELEPSSLKLLRPFQPATHAAVGITYLIVIVSAIVIKTNTLSALNRIMGISPRNSMVFYSWMIFMGFPIKLPKKSFLLHIVFLWILYSFFIRTMYQASLMDSMKTKKYGSNFETVEELIEANYKVGGGTGLREYFEDYPAVYNNFISMNASEINNTKLRISRGEKIGMTANLEAAPIFINNYGGAFHILEQKIVFSPTVIFFKKFSPLAESVNRILQHLVEAGIPDKFYRDYVQGFKKPPKHVDNKGPLTMDHYAGCYALLFCGWSLSFLLLLCEIFSKHYRRRRL